MEFKFRRSKRNSVGFGLAMLFVGLGVGAVTALLFAPKTGQQTRRTLKRKIEDAAETVSEFKEQATEVLERGAAFAKEATQAAKEKVAPIARAVTQGA
jgi:gas vesicle protein